MTKLTPVILCGGSGTRLWPRSRANKPKPFLPLITGETLFEEAISRCSNPEQFDPPVIVTGAAHLEHVEEQLHRKGARIIVEPAAKNTAAAIALAAFQLPEDAIMLVCPSDHHIANRAAFTAAAKAAAALATEGWLVSFGIEAKAPDTGFGYLQRGEPINQHGFRVARFVEKPDQARAEEFLANGGYSWNGGIFAFRVRDYINELSAHRPALAEAVRRACDMGTAEGNQFHPDPEAFDLVESESVDYAVMENTARAAMVPVDMNWSDIGNWQALHLARTDNASGNFILGNAELVDCNNVLVESDGPRVSAIGLEDVIIVVDHGEILVTTAAGAQRVGKLAGASQQ